MAGAALHITATVERQQDLLGQFGRLFENGLQEIGRRIGKTGKRIIGLILENIIEQK